jgi:hypothetical protein
MLNNTSEQVPFKDFFISYKKIDTDHASKISKLLEEEGYSVYSYQWNYPAGTLFPFELERIGKEAGKMVALLSPEYVEAILSKLEWAMAFLDETVRGKVVPVRVQPFDLPGMLRSLKYIDLSGLTDEKAKETLVNGLG